MGKYNDKHKAYTAEYLKAHYKEFKLRVNKDAAPAISARASALGLSVNAYIKRLIDEDMERAAADDATIE